jgi:shikimate dehydrogenase
VAGFLAQLVGSMSQGADANPTVAMVEAAFRHHDLDWRYVNMEVGPDDLGDAVRGARAMGFRGFNLSIPHKVTVIEHLDGLGRSAEIIGAVNCVVLDGTSMVGENTDGVGFVSSVRGMIDPEGVCVAVLGAGGAARAIAVELALAGAATIHIVNRDEGRGGELAALVSSRCRVPATFHHWAEPYAVPAECDVLVNATSVGYVDALAMPPIDLASLRPTLLVADVVVRSKTTPLLQLSAKRGCRTLDGLGMLVEQGAAAISRWAGVDPDRLVMRASLERALTP